MSTIRQTVAVFEQCKTDLNKVRIAMETQFSAILKKLGVPSEFKFDHVMFEENQTRIVYSFDDFVEVICIPNWVVDAEDMDAALVKYKKRMKLEQMERQLQRDAKNLEVLKKEISILKEQVDET